MTVPLLIAQLALQAVNGEPDAVEVMCDAIIESGWIDERPLQLCGIDWRIGPRAQQQEGITRENRVRKLFDICCARPTDWFAAAVAAVALFESWVTNALDWPVVAGCLRPYPQGRSELFLREPPADAYEGRIGGYADLRIQPMAPGALFNISRSTDETRLAGQRIDSGHDFEANIIEAINMIARK